MISLIEKWIQPIHAEIEFLRPIQTTQTTCYMPLPSDARTHQESGPAYGSRLIVMITTIIPRPLIQKFVEPSKQKFADKDTEPPFNRERELGSRGEKGETRARPPPRLCRREAPLPPLRFTIVTVEEASTAAVDCHWGTTAVPLVAGITDWREGGCLSYCYCFVLLSSVLAGVGHRICNSSNFYFPLDSEPDEEALRRVKLRLVLYVVLISLFSSLVFVITIFARGIGVV
ncbi:uncharacterized protein LOC107465005 [Arachis duranensis]|uniref:Uncharacterized protein LOC107465005 n=1 Tax=Arachis duranensis TaxID=130453 RepID=A0A9C6TK04_ARADU|nr:uncharacterized protein LOC107465005 [Arachis duranensis]